MWPMKIKKETCKLTTGWKYKPAQKIRITPPDYLVWFQRIIRPKQMPIQAFHTSIIHPAGMCNDLSPILDWSGKRTDQPFHVYGWARPQQKGLADLCVYGRARPRYRPCWPVMRILFGANMSTSKVLMWIWSHRHGLSKKCSHGLIVVPNHHCSRWLRDQLSWAIVWNPGGEPWQTQIKEAAELPNHNTKIHWATQSREAGRSHQGSFYVSVGWQLRQPLPATSPPWA